MDVGQSADVMIHVIRGTRLLQLLLCVVANFKLLESHFVSAFLFSSVDKMRLDVVWLISGKMVQAFVQTVFVYVFQCNFELKLFS